MDSNKPSEAQKPAIRPAQKVAKTSQHSATYITIRKITAWILIFSATFFALISVLAVWDVFGTDSGMVVWRAFATLAILSVAALIVMVSALMFNKADD